MSDARRLVGDAAALRLAFDRSFALPPQHAVQDFEDLLGIRVAGDAYAIRLRDITAVVPGRKVIPVPAQTPDLLGLVGIRAGIVPVFGLASILGYGQAADAPRWLVLCGAQEPVALGFTDFEGYLRLPGSALHTGETLHGVRQSARQCVEAIANTDSGLRAVIAIPQLVATIRDRIGRTRPAKGNHL